jgi:hypothetical protein
MDNVQNCDSYINIPCHNPIDIIFGNCSETLIFICKPIKIIARLLTVHAS